MEYPTVKLGLKDRRFPAILRHFSDPPAQLFCRGAELSALLKRPTVAIVGSRLMSPYGRGVTVQLAEKLAAQGVVIISGLAIGVDATAHEAALRAGGLAIAVLPSPVEQPAPAANRWLADKILATGGALVSEYPAGSVNNKLNFVARNRIVTGLADAVLITEAALGSGSLRSADFARDQNKTTLVVPGNITSPVSTGTNSLLKVGATPVTEVNDILFALNIMPSAPGARLHGRNPSEQLVLDLLVRGIIDGDELLEKSGLGTSEFNQTLTMLEITAKVRPLGMNQWSIC